MVVGLCFSSSSEPGQVARSTELSVIGSLDYCYGLFGLLLLLDYLWMIV